MKKWEGIKEGGTVASRREPRCHYSRLPPFRCGHSETRTASLLHGAGAGMTHRAAGWVEGGRTGRRGGGPGGRRWCRGWRGCNQRPPVYCTAPAASAFQPRCWCSPPGRAETPEERGRPWAVLWSGLALWIQASHNYMVRPCLEWMNEWLRNGRERTCWNSRKHFKALKYK